MASRVEASHGNYPSSLELGELVTVEKFDVANVPLLPHWILVTEAAVLLGISKQAVHNLIRAGEFADVHRMKQNEGNYIYVLRKAEVEAVRRERDARLSSEQLVGSG